MLYLSECYIDICRTFIIRGILCDHVLCLSTFILYRISELEEQLVKRNEAAVKLEERKKEQEEKIRQLEDSKAKVEQALAQNQQKVRIILNHSSLSTYPQHCCKVNETFVHS